MKGLIIKDIMCLRKQLTVFAYVMAAVVCVSVMYVLSARFGNIALAGRQILAENQMSAIDVKNLAALALILFMLLPIACIGDMANVFAADGKAGFYKICGAFPLSLKKRLLARFLTIYALFGIGVLIDLLLASVLSALTDILRFREFLGIIISSASVMSIYSALLIFFCILLGYGREQYAQIFSLLSMAAGTVLCNLKKTKQILWICLDIGYGKDMEPVAMWGAVDFIKQKAYILFLIACGVSILSFAAGYFIADRKRGMI